MHHIINYVQLTISPTFKSHENWSNGRTTQIMICMGFGSCRIAIQFPPQKIENSNSLGKYTPTMIPPGQTIINNSTRVSHRVTPFKWLVRTLVCKMIQPTNC